MLTRNEIARHFFTNYFGQLPSGSVIEIRVIRPSKGVVTRDWLTRPEDIDVTKYPDGDDIYFGVTLRQEGTTTATKSDLTHAVALWADVDNVANKPHMVAELKRLHSPTWVVDSGNGLHVYWRLKQPFAITDPARRDLLERIASGIAAHVKAPVGTHDSTRILRIPGTFNNKNGVQKLVVVLHEDLSMTHDILDLRKRYESSAYLSAGVPATSAVTAAPNTVAAGGAPALLLNVDQLPVTQEIRDLIRTGAPQGLRSETDAKVVKALTQSGLSYEQIESIYIDPNNAVGTKYREAGNGARYLKRTYAKATTWVDLTPAIQERGGVIEARHGKDWVQVLSHPLRCTKWLEGDIHALEVEVYRPDGVYRRRISGEDFSSKVAFKRALDMAAGWTGTDDDVQRLQEYLQGQNPPRRTARRVLGWHGEEVVFPNATLTPQGFQPGKYEYIGALSDARLEDMGPQDWASIARTALTALALMHDNGITVPAMGWMLATFAAPFVRKVSRQDAFPHLLLFGPSGTGKTTILEQIQAITGYGAGRIEPAPSITPFALIHSLSTSNTVPVLLDEYRRGRMERLHSALRAAYHAQLPKRGQSDLTVVNFRLQAPVAVAGESSFRDDALARRTISLRIENDKNDRGLDALRLAPLTQLNGGFYKLVMGTDLPAVWKQAQQRVDPKKFSEDTDARTVHNWTTAAFGLLLARDLIGMQEADTMIARFPEWRGEATRDTVVPSKQMMYDSLLAVKEMIRANRIRANTDYVFREDKQSGDQYLWFFSAQLPRVVEDYFTRNPSDHPVSAEAVAALLRTESRQPNSIVGAYQEHFSLRNKTYRGTALNLSEIERQYEIPVEQWTYLQVTESDRLQ